MSRHRIPRPKGNDGLPLRGHEREHLPLSEVRAREYPMVDGGITMGTICEYKEDGWTWVIVTDLPDTSWGEIFDENDERADEKVVRFLNLDLHFFSLTHYPPFRRRHPYSIVE